MFFLGKGPKVKGKMRPTQQSAQRPPVVAKACEHRLKDNVKKVRYIRKQKMIKVAVQNERNSPLPYEGNLENQSSECNSKTTNPECILSCACKSGPAPIMIPAIIRVYDNRLVRVTIIRAEDSLREIGINTN